jgi:hypothetical protein
MLLIGKKQPHSPPVQKKQVCLSVAMQRMFWWEVFKVNGISLIDMCAMLQLWYSHEILCTLKAHEDKTRILMIIW